MLDIWLPKSSAEESMQKSNHQDAKLHPLECKVTAINSQETGNKGTEREEKKRRLASTLGSQSLGI